MPTMKSLMPLTCSAEIQSRKTGRDAVRHDSLMGRCCAHGTSCPLLHPASSKWVGQAWLLAVRSLVISVMDRLERISM